MHIAVIGEILWDVFEDEERLGGAPFNFAAHSAQLGAEVTFLSAVASDARGAAARAQAGQLGLDGPYLQTVDAPPTGHVSVLLEQGQPDYEIHRPAAYDALALDDDALGALAAAAPDWLYFGTLFAQLPAPRTQLERLLEALPSAKRFYDVNLRKDSWSEPLLLTLLTRADVLKINEGEAGTLEELFGGPGLGLEAFAAWAARKWDLESIAITRGAEGCSLFADGRWVEAPSVPVELADAVGAGDAFSSGLVHALGQGWEAERAAAFANRVGALVASRPGAIPRWSAEEAWALG
ncbi:MAG: carbohydrate kinase [Bryobacterales bacterium]|nr:carbohydrate kinase [Bryobacterales bacterium]